MNLWHNISPVEKADSHVLSWDSIVLIFKFFSVNFVLCFFTFSWVALDHLVVWLKTHLWWTSFFNFNFHQFVNLGDLVNSKCIVIGLVGRHHWRVGGQRIVDPRIRHLRLIEHRNRIIYTLFQEMRNNCNLIFTHQVCLKFIEVNIKGPIKPVGCDISFFLDMT